MKNLKAMKTLILLISISSLCFGQVEVRPIVGFDYRNSFNVFNWVKSNDENYYNKQLAVGFNISIQTILKRSSIDFCFNYQYEGTTKDRELFFHTYRYYGHLIGGSVKYTYGNEQERFRPFVKITGLNEIKTNKYHSFLIYNILTSYPEHTYVTALGSQGNPPYVYDYSSNFYESTPFVGSALLGCDFRIIDHLHATVGIGYGIRVMKTKYLEWHEWEDEVGTTDLEKLLKTAPVTTHLFHLLDVQVGIYYGISFKKKENGKL